MDLNKAIALKVDQLLEDIQEHLQLISLNMVVCLRNKDLNQPDRWLTSSPQASSLVNKAVMVDHQPSHLLNMATNKWPMVVLPARVVMVVASRLQTPNGALHQPKASAMASVVTKANFLSLLRMILRPFRTSFLNSVDFAWSFGGHRDMKWVS
jgi:hypothetical protein